MKKIILCLVVSCFFSCTQKTKNERKQVEAQYSLPSSKKHNKWSRTIRPALTVPDVAIVEAYTEEATDGQLNIESKTSDISNVAFDPIHPLTVPVYVEGAQPGDVLAVTLHKIEVGDWQLRIL